MEPQVHESSLKERIRAARLYCVTTQQDGPEGYRRIVEQACKGGADVVQLRDKKMADRERVACAKELKKICRAHGAIFILNDRLDLALAAGADGVHLGQDDMPVAEARWIVDAIWSARAQYTESTFLIGCSTHSVEQAAQAQHDGADYIGCGPVFATPTKPAYGEVGLSLVREYRKRIQIPFVAIGGIDESNVHKVLKAGAHCVAVVRAAFDKPDPEAAVRSLKAKVLSAPAR